jgi:hypothetical protein
LQPIKKIAFTALIVTKETTGLDNLYDDVGYIFKDANSNKNKTICIRIRKI